MFIGVWYEYIFKYKYAVWKKKLNIKKNDVKNIIETALLKVLNVCRETPETSK